MFNTKWTVSICWGYVLYSHVCEQTKHVVGKMTACKMMEATRKDLTFKTATAHPKTTNVGFNWSFSLELICHEVPRNYVIEKNCYKKTILSVVLVYVNINNEEEKSDQLLGEAGRLTCCVMTPPSSDWGVSPCPDRPHSGQNWRHCCLLKTSSQETRKKKKDKKWTLRLNWPSDEKCIW